MPTIPGRVLVLPVAMAAVVTGCGGDPGNAPSTPSSTVSSSTTTRATTTGATAAGVDMSDLNIAVLMELRPTENRAISVSCPGDLAAEVGATVICEVDALNGKTLKVTVTATSVTGGSVDYEITNIS